MVRYQQLCSLALFTTAFLAAAPTVALGPSGRIFVGWTQNPSPGVWAAYGLRGRSLNK